MDQSQRQSLMDATSRILVEGMTRVELMTALGIDIISSNSEAIKECQGQMELPDVDADWNHFLRAVINHLCSVRAYKL
jgi:hypothetical protein